MSKETIIAYTDGGSVDVKGQWYGGWGMYLNYPNGTEVQVYQGMPVGTTNNRAEMEGLAKLYEFALDNKWTSVAAHLDSQLVLEGVQFNLPKWKAKQWLKSDGEPVKNQDLWQRLDALQSQVKAANIDFVYKWVKGHSGVIGNEYADAAAKMATAKSIAGEHTEHWIKLTQANDVTAEDAATETKKAKAKKAPPYNALLCGNKILDVANNPDRNDCLYYVTSTETPAKKDIPHRFIGVASADRFEGSVMLNAPEPIMHAIRNKQDQVMLMDYQIPVIYNWSTIRSSKNWQIFFDQGTDCLMPTSKGDLDFWDGTEISYLFRTARCAWFALDTLDVKTNLLAQYRNAPETLTLIDITNEFIETGAKGKITLQDRLARSKRMDVLYKYIPDKRALVIPLVQDKSIPDRNTFNRILKQDKSFTVQLVIHDQTPSTFRWSIIIETPSGIGCFNNPSTNLMLVP